MQRAIVTTTINPPTSALIKFAEIADRDGWMLIIVGDQKTPHEAYTEFCARYECATYISPAMQDAMSLRLSELIGWNCIQRRNFGLIEAWRREAEVIAMVDDDNIPYDDWGRRVAVGLEVNAVHYHTDQPVFDPLAPIFPHLWHRGFPIQLLEGREAKKIGLKKRNVLVQADFWDEDPDIDAVARITLAPRLKFNRNMAPIAGDKPMPFNSQNTFISSKILPTYFLFPHIGRMDDIWAAYVAQSRFPDSVIFARPSVRQERNAHDLTKDLQAEMIGYQHTLDLIKWLATITPDVPWPEWMPQRAIEAYAAYMELFQ